MAKKKEIDKVKLSAFPEEVDKDGLKWYGEMSYETQMAVLSHYLHADKKNLPAEEREEIIYAVKEFLARKKYRQKDGEVNHSKVLVLIYPQSEKKKVSKLIKIVKNW